MYHRAENVCVSSNINQHIMLELVKLTSYPNLHILDGIFWQTAHIIVDHKSKFLDK